MALVFPRAMPASGIGQQVFRPQQINLESAEAGGAAYGIGVGLKRWRAEWTLAGSIQQTDSDQWAAFIASLDGAKRTFIGRDVHRPFPLLYPAGFAGVNRAVGGAFDGSCAKWVQSITADGQALLSIGQVGTSVLPANFQVSTGDYMDFRWTTSGIERRHLVAALEPATANSSGVITGLTIDPPVHALLVPSTAVLHFDNPGCVMRLRNETEVTPMDRRGKIGAKIVALQDLRA